MKKLCANPMLRDGAVGLALLIAIGGLLWFPTEAISAAEAGLSLCYHVIIPSLFPFFVLSTLVVELGLARYLGRVLQPIMMPLFRVNGNCGTALALGFVGGYPVGAKTAISLYRQGLCTRGEALRLLAFCNNSGPAFILGVVGAGIFSSSRVGLLLYAVHGMASLLVGILFRWYPVEEGEPCGNMVETVKPKRATTALVGAIGQSFQSTLNICAFVVFFTVVIALFTASGLLPWLAGGIALVLSPFSVSTVAVTQWLTGLVELSSGVWSLNGDGELGGTLSLAAFMLGWAGISVHFQVLSFLGDCDLSAKTYVLGKLFHGIISAVLVYMLTCIIHFEHSVSTVLAIQVEDLSHWDFQSTFVGATLMAWMVFLLFLTVGLLSMKKKTGKDHQSMLS